ncbi:unnamed protein product [Meganyctiphanes norvegica]|uniref:CUB domain-containing protein n=1 Tax=Meganyctiphanes norvegica TaxID=48144 RepID=A0AAV2RL59_MEGNR
MIKHVLSQVLVLVGMVGSLHSWPVMPGQQILREELTNTDIALKCGKHEQLVMDHTEMITLTAGDITKNNLYNASCDVTIRVALRSSATALEKYGMKVEGLISFRDGSRDCTNSFISVADEDTLDDEMGTLVKYCGGPNKKISFETTEDYINIEVSVGSERATRGSGFTITIEPHFVCGGIIALETTIESPYYPQPYPRDISCFWEVKAPKGFDISLTCPVFQFPNPNKAGRCSDDLMINHANDVDVYCGSQLLNKQKHFAGEHEMLLVFRSDESKNVKNKGISCNITFVPE